MRNLNIKTANIFGITFLVAERSHLVHVLAASSLDIVQDFNGNDFDPKDLIGAELKKNGAFGHLTNINSVTGRLQYIRCQGDEGRTWQAISEFVPEQTRATVTDGRLASYGRSGIITEVTDDFSKVFLRTDAEMSQGRAGRWYNMDRVSTRSELFVDNIVYVVLGDLRGQFVKLTNQINNRDWACKSLDGAAHTLPAENLVRVSLLQKIRFSMFGYATAEAFVEAFNAISGVDNVVAPTPFWLVAVHVDEDTYQPTHPDGLYAPRRKFYIREEAVAAMNSMAQRHNRTFFLMESVEYRAAGSESRVAFEFPANEEVQA